jgi:hypothetical protein
LDLRHSLSSGGERDIIPVFIGYDAREVDAYEVCRASLLRYASMPLFIRPLVQGPLRQMGLYRRGTKLGDPWSDYVDGAMFSTEFTFTRFLVMALMQWDGWAIFMDCDFMARADITELWALREDRYALQCVKHDHNPVSSVKMDGRAQYNYSRKNWSSMMLINCSHFGHGRLSVDDVNTKPKRWLHNMRWLQDYEIGELPECWNWLSGHSESENPKLVHFTEGIPSMPGYQSFPYADEWRENLRHAVQGCKTQDAKRKLRNIAEEKRAMGNGRPL